MKTLATRHEPAATAALPTVIAQRPFPPATGPGRSSSRPSTTTPIPATTSATVPFGVHSGGSGTRPIVNRLTTAATVTRTMAQVVADNRAFAARNLRLSRKIGRSAGGRRG